MLTCEEDSYRDGMWGFISMHLSVAELREFLEVWETAPKPRSWKLHQTAVQYAMLVFDQPRSWIDKFARECGGPTDARVQFVTETLMFIIHGKPRQFHFATWGSLISISRHKDEYYGKQSRLPVPIDDIPYDTVEFVRQWCSRENGIEDMVCTLRAMFESHEHFRIKTPIPRAIDISFPY